MPKREKNTPDYSVVIPVYNEQENIPILYQELKKVMDSLSSNYEIIFVDDGSKDKSLLELKKLKDVKIIRLNRNYGQATALDAGFKLTQGEIIVSLDSDLQNDPKDIPRLVNKLRLEELDVVAGWRKHRKDKVSISVLSKFGRLLRKIIIHDNVHDTGCTLRAYRNEAVKSLDISGEMHRYILALLRWKGFKIGELEVNHRPRIHGKTKYGYNKAVRGFVDLIYIWFIQKYSSRPLHIFGEVGLWASFLGFLSFVWAIYQKIFNSISLNRSGWFFLGIFGMLVGIIFFSFGIVMDLIIKTYLNTSPSEKKYYIREIIEK